MYKWLMILLRVLYHASGVADRLVFVQRDWWKLVRQCCNFCWNKVRFTFYVFIKCFCSKKIVGRVLECPNTKRNHNLGYYQTLSLTFFIWHLRHSSIQPTIFNRAIWKKWRHSFCWIVCLIKLCFRQNASMIQKLLFNYIYIGPNGVCWCNTKH